MKLRTLGKTLIEVSEIAFGGVEIGMPYGIGVHSHADMISREHAIRLLHEALDKGINFFDTARLYGESESIMGEAFSDRRDRVVLATKCRHFRDDSGAVLSGKLLEKTIEGSLEESLSLLRTDYVDLFMLHQADIEILNNDHVREIFMKLKSTGKVRSIGASTYSSEETRTAIEKSWEVIQCPFNLMDQRQQQNFQLANENGTGIVIRSVLMKGLLSDKGRGLHEALKDVENHIKKYHDLLSDSIPDISTLAMKFALSFNEVSSVLVGIDRLEYLEKALTAVSAVDLNQSDLYRAKKLEYPDPDFLDLPRWDRLGWLT